MRIAQTIGELGLEKGILAAWPEPRAGQGLRPKFGTRPFPRKPLYAVLLVLIFIFGSAAAKGSTVSPFMIVGTVAAVGIAWPLVSLLDRITRRNVWIYPDRVLVTHANDKVTVGKSDLKQVVVYAVRGPALFAFEFVEHGGKSHVVAVPDDVNLDELLDHLRNGGYEVRSDV